MYTFSDLSHNDISSLSEDYCLLSFTVRENSAQKKEIQATKNKLLASENFSFIVSCILVNFVIIIIPLLMMCKPAG